MAKGSGGTRTLMPKDNIEKALSRINEIVKDEFSPKSVFGHTLTAGDASGFMKLRAWLTNGDEYDINMSKLSDELKRRSVDAEVDIKDIYPIQNYLNKTQVARYMQNPERNLSDRGLSITGYRLPNGKVILDDGHHRVAASIINGERTVKMKVVNVNEYYANKWFKSLSKKK